MFDNVGGSMRERYILRLNINDDYNNNMHSVYIMQSDLKIIRD